MEEKHIECENINFKLSQREQVKTLFTDIKHNPSKYYFIHYSSEDIVNNKGMPKSFSICISHPDESGVKNFSVLNEALTRNINIEDIGSHYDELELAMLTKFLEYVEKTFNAKYQILLHWNMKNSSYGFDALLLRYEILSHSDKYNNFFDKFTKINLSSEFVKLYGEKYADKPRLKFLIKKNNVDYHMSEKFTSSLLNEGKYNELHLSFNARYEAMLSIIIYAVNGRLKTKYNIIDRYGASPAGIFEAIKDDWRLAFISAVVWLLIAVFIEKLIF